MFWWNTICPVNIRSGMILVRTIWTVWPIEELLKCIVWQCLEFLLIILIKVLISHLINIIGLLRTSSNPLRRNSNIQIRLISILSCIRVLPQLPFVLKWVLLIKVTLTSFGVVIINLRDNWRYASQWVSVASLFLSFIFSAFLDGSRILKLFGETDFVWPWLLDILLQTTTIWRVNIRRLHWLRVTYHILRTRVPRGRILASLTFMPINGHSLLMFLHQTLLGDRLLHGVLLLPL